MVLTWGFPGVWPSPGDREASVGRGSWGSENQIRNSGNTFFFALKKIIKSNTLTTSSFIDIFLI